MSDETEDAGEIMPPVSNSEIQTWKSCHRRWYLSFYRGLQPKAQDRPLSGALRFGSKMHIALELFYADDVNPIETVEQMFLQDLVDLRRYSEWYGIDTTDERAKVQKERELAHAMLSGYLEWVAEEGADEGLKLIATEATIEVASDIPGIKIRGKLDQRVMREVDGAQLFLDHKTLASFDQPSKLLPMDEQMKMYMLLECMEAEQKVGYVPPDVARGALYNMLRKVKRTAKANPPFYKRIEVQYNQLAIQNMRTRVHRVLEELAEARKHLDAGEDHQYWAYPRPSRDCTWACPFVRVCPMMDDSPRENWEAALEANFEKHDPYERYGDKEEEVN